MATVMNHNSDKKPKQRYYRSEQQTCPICHRFLKRSHIQWRKRLLFPTGWEAVTSWAYRCGVVSDAQESIRMAVALSLPGTPHQVCQFHALRDAGALIFESDRSLKTHLKGVFPGQLGCLEGAIARLPHSDPHQAILADYALAIHSTLLEGGVAPFGLAGIQVFDALRDIAGSLQRCQKKGATGCCLAC
jgi:hypothetical protein